MTREMATGPGLPRITTVGRTIYWGSFFALMGRSGRAMRQGIGSGVTVGGIGQALTIVLQSMAQDTRSLAVRPMVITTASLAVYTFLEARAMRCLPEEAHARQLTTGVDTRLNEATQPIEKRLTNERRISAKNS